jgi:hypothetical protein
MRLLGTPPPILPRIYKDWHKSMLLEVALCVEISDMILMDAN